MNCVNCGTPLAFSDKVCPICGTPRPLVVQDFADLEKRTAELYLQHTNRQVTEEHYRAVLRQCVLPDPSGGAWTIDPAFREWLWFDGKRWVKRNPYKSAGSGTNSRMPGPGGKPRTWLWILLGIALALILIEVTLVGWQKGWLRFGPRQSYAVAALAYRMDDLLPVLSLYVGRPDEDPFTLPSGRYYIEAIDQKSEGISMGIVEVGGVGVEMAIVDFPRLFAREEDLLSPFQVTEVNDLMEFILLTEVSKMTFYQTISRDFSTLPYSSGEDISMSALDPLFETFFAMEERTAVVSEALESFQARALQALSQASSGADLNKKGQTLVRPKQITGLLIKFASFFGRGSVAADNARTEMLAAYAAMPEAEREEAFQMVEESNRAGAENFADFIVKLQNGEVGTSATLGARRDLYNDWGYQAAAQTPGINRPCLNTAHTEGAELVTAGAELYVDIVKTVLTTNFPDIKTGVDWAEKADKWSNYIRDLMNDPARAAENFTFDQLKDALTDQIKGDLGEINPGISDDEVEEIAGEIAQAIVKQNQQQLEVVKTKAPGFFDWVFGNKPTQTPSAESPEDEDLLIPTETPTLQPTVTATSEVTNTPEPTADTSWIDPYVSSVSDELINLGYDADVVAGFADSLRGCLRDGVNEGRSETSAKNHCKGAIDNFKKSPTPTPAMRFFGGNWNSGVLCGEADDPMYTWVVSLSQSSSGAVTGSISFHNCPGGGAVYYSVSGQATSASVLVLDARKTNGRGDLGSNSASNAEIQIQYYGPPRFN